jgi:hypothetical protein
MRISLIMILVLAAGINLAKGQTLMTRSGTVTFFSYAPLEDIKADNTNVRAILNTDTGEILIRMRIEDFQFKKSLMQRHFNEDYLESHLYPESHFSGSIKEFNLPGYSQSPVAVAVEGNMTIHGVTNFISEKGTIKKTGKKLVCEAVFMIKVADYDVKIPRLLVRNIAETVEVTVKLELD